jgi:uncharacterized protein YbjT (DUF2867 family)
VSEAPLTLVTGASGYVGGRLVPELERRGRRVRCLARRPEHVRPRVGAATEVVAGDLLDAASLEAALAGVDAACYLVHSMGSRGDFEAEDRRAAVSFAAAARAAGVRRIAYLGGLGREPGLSRHLRSRQEVGRILRESGVPTIELRASIVIGSGSLSFEMVRALVERLPVMVTPRWVSQPTQPLAIEDLVQYLAGALELPVCASTVVEIGGPDRVSYADLMREYARQRGLGRLMLRVPVLSPRLSSLWLGLVTPLYARVGRELVESTRNATVVDDDSARRLFPALRPRGVREAIARALLNEERAFAETRWSDALSSGDPRAWGGASFGPRLVDSRSLRLPQPPGEVFLPVRRIGGATGWYYGDWLWRLRGFLDRLVGGVGLRRGPPRPRAAAARRRAPAPARRDEAAGPGLAPVRARAGGGWHAAAADRDLRAARARRPRLLVRPLSRAPAHLRRDAARDRERRVATAWVTPAVAAVSSMPQAMSTALTSADQPVSTASAVRSNVEYATRPSSAPRAATETERAAVVSAWTTSSLTPTRYTA